MAALAHVWAASSSHSLGDGGSLGSVVVVVGEPVIVYILLEFLRRKLQVFKGCQSPELLVVYFHPLAISCDAQLALLVPELENIGDDCQLVVRGLVDSEV